MKRKKLLSTAVAGMLVAAQMVMPVMAADGGEVDVTVTTETAVIRVQVPTSLAIAVDQFEKKDAGSQIYSGDFTIENKSEIPVKMTVTSVVTLGNSTSGADNIGLVSEKAAVATSSEEKGEAWLAVAAMIAEDAYVASDKTIADLSEASDNVKPFALVDDTNDADNGKGKAEQVFYLAASDTPAVTYKILKPTTDDELAAANQISYAQIYELSVDATITDTAKLQAKVDTTDVVEEDGTTIKLIKKGTKGVTFNTATGVKYYTVSTTAKTPGTLENNKVYVYGEATNVATTGGAAGFRYIGKLSDKEVWTSDDISNVKIKYDIKGVTTTKYDELADADSIEYGLYVGSTASVVNPSITSGATAAASGADHDYTADFTKGTNLVFNVDFGNQGATAVSSLMLGPSIDALKTNTVIISSANNVVTLKGDSWATANAGDLRFCKINFDDGSALIIKITIQ